ncbi:peroxiredoxin [Planktosalinus lacus]|uniref:thioredoxin-dependent peroxiredoxin n=2 Tax=Planktosalinus lacus TaxID=1526573 RepID=A0A8J2VBG3_9FLAO|nr:peroxiredoxin [Planktosalinus lacus]
MTTTAQIPENAEAICPILVGQQIPEVNLLNLNNQSVELMDLVKEKPTVLVVYRGGWCPFCSTHLAALNEVEKDIQLLGYQLIAISPDEVVDLISPDTDEQVSYRLFSDPQSQFIKQIGVAFKTPETLSGYIASKNPQGRISEVMPVPTLLVINTQGEVEFTYINPNYKQRISGALLLAVLNSLKK